MKHLKKTLDGKASLGGFIKSNEEPNQSLSSEEKVLLNRKANILFNEGNLFRCEFDTDCAFFCFTIFAHCVLAIVKIRFFIIT